MTDPYVGNEISLTLKVPESRRYAADGPWIVIRGTDSADVARLAAEATGISSEGLTLLDVALNAQSAISGLGTVTSKLGARVESNDSNWGKPAENAEPAQSEDDLEEQQAQAMVSKIEAVTTVDALQDLWARNQAIFQRDEVMSAYKSKGKALTS